MSTTAHFTITHSTATWTAPGKKLIFIIYIFNHVLVKIIQFYNSLKKTTHETRIHMNTFFLSMKIVNFL